MSREADLWDDVLQGGLGTARRIPGTIVRLYRRPGSLSRAWADDERSGYVPPVRLYVLAALLFFLVWPRWSKGLSTVQDLLHGYLVGSGRPNTLPPGGLQFLASHFESAVSVLLVPWMGLMTWILVQRSHRYTDHLVFALDYQVFAMLLILLTVPISQWVPHGVDAVTLLLVGLVVSLRGAFELGWLRALVTGAAISMGYVLGTLGLGFGLVALGARL